MIGDIPDLLTRRAERSPGTAALEEIAGGRCLTYAELENRAARAASLLRERGVGEGDRVALLCRNRIAFFELLFACAKAGAILVPLNWRMPPAELDGLIADCAPKLLLFGAEDSAAARALADCPAAIGLDEGYDELVEAAAPLASPARWPADGIWYLLYTSGTTGRPKGVIHTFRMAVANYVNIGSAIDLASTDTTANFLPLFHTAGINLHSLPTLIQGGRVVILGGFDAEQMVRLFEARRLDTFFAVPTIYQALLDHPRFAAAPLDQVRHWGCGGAPLPDILVERCRALGIRICNGMGMTETGPTAFLAAPADAWERIGSVGKPQLLVSVRIAGPDGADVAEGEVGDLLFAGPAVTPGYWNDAEATRAAFTPDGWLRSGDLARRDADGFYWVAGRRKEMFISGGENVYPAEVEAALSQCKGVAECSVLGIPHPRWGETGLAAVTLRRGTKQTAENLRDELKAMLAGYKVPSEFMFLKALPKTGAGKIDKPAIRALYEAQRPAA
jgi:fatty-acyl-CoA synthase